MELGEARERIAEELVDDITGQDGRVFVPTAIREIAKNKLREMSNLVLDRAIENLWHGPDCLPITPRKSKRMQDRLYAINKLRAMKEE